MKEYLVRLPDEPLRFCPLCTVTLDLHDGPDSCDVAQRKAALLDRFNWMLP